MRGAWIVATALVVGWVAGPARAGVYNTAEPWPLPGRFDQFQLQWAGYRTAAAELPNRVCAAVATLTAEDYPLAPGLPFGFIASLAAQGTLGPPERSVGLYYLRQVAALEEQERQGLLSLEGRSNLGAYLIRLGHYDRAIRVMENAPSQSHFLLLANLATAHELAGDPQRQALGYRRRALRNWPKIFAAWDTPTLNFYRKAEEYHYRLLEARQKEPPSRGRLRLDDLFPVDFEDPKRTYEVGGIDPDESAKIPADAHMIVMQLLLWTPFDDRLTWMLGELLNANGDVRAAAEVLRPLVLRGRSQTSWSSLSPELEAHYRLLAKGAAEAKALADALTVDPAAGAKELLLLAPRTDDGGAVALALTELTRREAVRDIDARARGAGAAASTPAPAPAAKPTPAETWVPNWRQLAVGFGAGAAVALLLGMQVRQMGRPKG